MSAIDVETTTAQRRIRQIELKARCAEFPRPAAANGAPLAIEASIAIGFQSAVESQRAFADRLLFSGMWLVIACVSTIDTYLTIRFRESLLYEELNPVARLLLRLDGWEPSLLIGAKFLGSILVLGFIGLLYSQNRRMGLVVTGALTGFQLGLLAFLTLI